MFHETRVSLIAHEPRACATIGLGGGSQRWFPVAPASARIPRVSIGHADIPFANRADTSQEFARAHVHLPIAALAGSGYHYGGSCGRARAAGLPRLRTRCCGGLMPSTPMHRTRASSQSSMEAGRRTLGGDCLHGPWRVCVTLPEGWIATLDPRGLAWSEQTPLGRPRTRARGLSAIPIRTDFDARKALITQVKSDRGWTHPEVIRHFLHCIEPLYRVFDLF